MTTEYNISNIYRSLQKHGIDKKFIKDILLPDWWDDEIANSKIGYLQTLSLIAKNLGIDISGLLNDPNSVSFTASINIKFKASQNIDLNTTDIWPNSLAIKINELISQTYSVPLQLLPDNAIDIRKLIIGKYEKITLENVLDFLWSSGIPVLHISEFPKEVNKMDGMAVNFNDRPIIITSKNRRHDPWLLFIVLHELGHIINGHLSSNENIIYDYNLETEIEEDNEEKIATDFALEVLTGSKSTEYLSLDKVFDTGYKLINYIRPISKNLHLAPGSLALIYAHKTNNYALASSALNILNPNADAMKLMHSKIGKYLNLENLSEENYEYFSKLI